MNQPLRFVSIVVPTRNRAGMLRDCVKSLLAQDLPADGYEIIVVDDGSTDETPDVVAEFRARTGTPHVWYVRPEGRGLNVARNAGLRAARGDPIVLVDDDVVAPRSWLNAIAEGSLRHPQAHCLGGPVRLRLEGNPPRLCHRDRLAETELDLGSAEGPIEAVRGANIPAVDAVVGANLVLRRVAIEKVGMFNEVLSGFGDDTEWKGRLLAAGGQIVYLPEAWLWHRRSAADLRLWRLVRKRFRQGIEDVAFARVIGQRMSILRELRAIPGFLAHAVRRRCAAGLLSASMRAGRAWALARERPPVTPGSS